MESDDWRNSSAFVILRHPFYDHPVNWDVSWPTAMDELASKLLFQEAFLGGTAGGRVFIVPSIAPRAYGPACLLGSALAMRGQAVLYGDAQVGLLDKDDYHGDVDAVVSYLQGEPVARQMVCIIFTHGPLVREVAEKIGTDLDLKLPSLAGVGYSQGVLLDFTKAEPLVKPV